MKHEFTNEAKLTQGCDILDCLMKPLSKLIEQHERILKESRKIKPKKARNYFCRHFHKKYHRKFNDEYVLCKLCEKKTKI